MGKQKRSADDIRRTIEEFQNSGLTRREFCQRRQIGVTTLDYWRRARRQPQLAEIEVAASEPEARPGFTLRLANGRHIESSWRFSEVELARLIRIAESA